MPDPETVRAVFKAYDVRGLAPEQIDEPLARATGRAHAQVTGSGTVVVGHDMRPSSPGLARAFATGATEAGADVVMIGLASTDMLYFASGHLGVAGAMFTASHNPAQYNGIKLCRADAVPLGLESGLDEIRDLVLTPRPTVGEPGEVRTLDLLDAYAEHLISLVPITGSRGLKIVADAGNGMAGHTAPAVFQRLPEGLVELVPMYFVSTALPPPRGEPDRAGQPPRPPGPRGPRGRRPRAGLRRRCRPLLPGRRAGRRGLAVGAHGADRQS